MSDNLIEKRDLQESYIVTKDLGIKEISNFDAYCCRMNDDALYIENLDEDENFMKLVELGNALSSDIRIKMLYFIYRVKTTCFYELENIFKLKKSTLNYHVKMLLKSGLVRTSKKGKVVVIELGRDFDQLIPESFKSSFNSTIIP